MFHWKLIGESSKILLGVIMESLEIHWGVITESFGIILARSTNYEGMKSGGHLGGHLGVI